MELRVILRPPPHWFAHDDSTWVLPGPPVTPPEVVVQVGALQVAPEDLAAWKLAASRAHAPAPVVTVTEAETPFVTEAGWPALRLRMTFATEAGVVVEYRVVALYQFLHLVAAVLVRSLSGAALAARQEELRAVLTGATPDFATEEPVALIEFWE